MRTGELARAAGVNRETLRYYERRGLIAEPTRTPGGQRDYPATTVDLLRAIKAAQRLGFTLEEAAELADHGLRRQAGAKLAEIEAKIAELEVVAGNLRSAIAAGCDDLALCATIDRCPVPFPH